MLPLDLYFFGNALTIREVKGSGFADRIGWQVLSIEGIPVAALVERIRPLVSHENEVWLKAKCPAVIGNLDALQWAGIGDGRTVTLELFNPATSAIEKRQVSGRWAEEMAILPEVSPLKLLAPAMSFPRLDTPFWHEVSKDGRTLYFQWNACLHPQSPYNQYAGKTWPVESYFRELAMLLKQGKFDKVIVDLRYNGGGNSSTGDEFIRRIRNMRHINRPDVLHVLIGRDTFSSAVMHGISFQNLTKASLVGEATGGKPNSFGDIRFIDLTAANGNLSYSTKFFRLDPQNRDSVFPDRLVPTTYSLWSSGRDDAMESILGMGWEARFVGDQ
jgi:hypothetical protein